LHKSIKYQNFTKIRPAEGVYVWTDTANLQDAFSRLCERAKKRGCCTKPTFTASFDSDQRQTCIMQHVTWVHENGYGDIASIYTHTMCENRCMLWHRPRARREI